MTDRELKRLKRDQLLEILVYMRKEIDRLNAENETLKLQLEERSKVSLSKEDVASIMEAVNKVLTSN
jgi:hypothetical protein